MTSHSLDEVLSSVVSGAGGEASPPSASSFVEVRQSEAKSSFKKQKYSTEAMDPEDANDIFDYIENETAPPAAVAARRKIPDDHGEDVAEGPSPPKGSFFQRPKNLKCMTKQDLPKLTAWLDDCDTRIRRSSEAEDGIFDLLELWPASGEYDTHIICLRDTIKRTEFKMFLPKRYTSTNSWLVPGDYRSLSIKLQLEKTKNLGARPTVTLRLHTPS